MSLIIPNTIITMNNTRTQYYVTPNEGYVMHDKNYDTDEVDENYMPTGNIILGYRPTTASIHINRDLSERTMLDENGNTVTAYTEREFFCKLRTEVPENQIFGVDGPEHEIM